MEDSAWCFLPVDLDTSLPAVITWLPCGPSVPVSDTIPRTSMISPSWLETVVVRAMVWSLRSFPSWAMVHREDHAVEGILPLWDGAVRGDWLNTG